MTDVFAIVETSLGEFGLAPLMAARAAGLRTVLVTARPDRYTPSHAAAQAFAGCVDEIREADTTDVSAVVSALSGLARLRGVYSLTDYSVHVAAQVARALGLPGLSPDAARTARDKLATRRACARAGVPVPGFSWVRSVDDAVAAVARLGLPCVVKPLTEAGSIGVVLCRTAEEVVQHYETITSVRTDYRGQPRPSGVLVEELLLGYEVSVETVTLEGEHVIIGMTDKLLGPLPHFVEVGHDFPSILPEPVTEGCTALARAALDAVGHDFGAAHVEVKVTSTGAKLVEVNARLAGAKITTLVRESAGIDLPKEIVRLHAGLPSLLSTGTGILHSGGAAARYLTAPISGTLRAVRGMDLARRLPGVVELAIEAEPGDPVRRAENNVDYLGHLVAVGTTTGEAIRVADAALGQLSVEVDPG